MTWTHSITGSLSVYISAVMLLHCSSIPVQSNTKVRAPKIRNITHKPLGDGYRLTCKVNPGGLKDETLVYWLADGDFLETVYENITVINTEKKSDSGTEYLFSKVVFKNLSQKDFHTNFTCIALSPAGFATENVQLRSYAV